MSSDRPLSVAERIAALQKSASNNNSSTSSSSPNPTGEGIQVGGGKKKVSALAGDLSTKLNVNALLGGGSVGGVGIGGVPRGGSGNRPSSSANHHVEPTADPSRSTTQTMSTKPNDDNEITKRGELCHPPRAMIPPGRRRRRGSR